MRINYRTSEFIISRGTMRCQECGHKWSDEGQLHDPDCRFFFVELDEEDDSCQPLRLDVQLELSFRKAS